MTGHLQNALVPSVRTLTTYSSISDGLRVGSRSGYCRSAGISKREASQRVAAAREGGSRLPFTHQRRRAGGSNQETGVSCWENCPITRGLQLRRPPAVKTTGGSIRAHQLHPDDRTSGRSEHEIHTREFISSPQMHTAIAPPFH
ncbi:hypothetical protein Q5P01_022736 [Channa striata]|uniref:Uncharacterized protein n=1 Tax=Channa striata TaxID=64152 RepID=A0AA88LRL9_CHASR|nr:hypothetical protein Q5P01_022736 [Channa striata]